MSLLAAALALLPRGGAGSSAKPPPPPPPGAAPPRHKHAAPSGTALAAARAGVTTPSLAPPAFAPRPPSLARAPTLSAPATAALTRLQTELSLCADVLRSSHNQHRRSPYYRAFSQLHALARRVADAVARGGSDCARSRAVVTRALVAALPLCRRVLAPHTGGGFAGLGAVFAASAAVYHECLTTLSAAGGEVL